LERFAAPLQAQCATLQIHPLLLKHIFGNLEDVATLHRDLAAQMAQKADTGILDCLGSALPHMESVYVSFINNYSVSSKALSVVNAIPSFTVSVFAYAISNLGFHVTPLR